MAQVQTTTVNTGSFDTKNVKKTPADFLKSVLGRPVVVKLHSGVEYRGILACLDGYMNIALEQTEEYIAGEMKNRYGDSFIRGNNDLKSRVMDIAILRRNGGRSKS